MTTGHILREAGGDSINDWVAKSTRGPIGCSQDGQPYMGRFEVLLHTKESNARELAGKSGTVLAFWEGLGY